MALQGKLPLLGIHAAILACGVLLGLVAGLDPKLAVAAALCLAFVVIVMADLAVGVSLFAVLACVDVLPVGGAAVTFTKAAGLLLALSWLATVTTSRDARNDLFSAYPILGALLVLFVAWIGLSTVWAESSAESLSSFYRWFLQVALFVIVFTAVRTSRHAVWVIAAFLVGATISAGYGLISPAPPISSDDVSRLTGAGIDPNQLATLMVGALAFAAAFAAGWKGSPLKQWAAIGAAVFCASSLILSVSRTGLVAMGVALLAAVVLGGRWRPVAAGLLVLLAFTTIGYFTYYAPPEARARIQTTDGTGREDIWKVGWRMVEAEPVRGVGVGNFATSSVHYLLAPGSILRDEFIVDEPKQAHNLYLEVLAELGIVGLALFMAVLVFALGCGVRAAEEFKRKPDPRMELLTRALCVAIIGTLAANFFLSGQFSKQLWILLALGPALLVVARREQPGAPQARV